MKKINQWFYWTPRILSIIFIFFLALMSLDVFESDQGLEKTILGLFMHNLPALILLVVLIISWKTELVGGIVFILAGLISLLLVLRNPFEWIYLLWVGQISGIAFLIGVLFLIGWCKKRR